MFASSRGKASRRFHTVTGSAGRPSKQAREHRSFVTAGPADILGGVRKGCSTARCTLGVGSPTQQRVNTIAAPAGLNLGPTLATCRRPRLRSFRSGAPGAFRPDLLGASAFFCAVTPCPSALSAHQRLSPPPGRSFLLRPELLWLIRRRRTEGGTALLDNVGVLATIAAQSRASAIS